MTKKLPPSDKPTFQLLTFDKADKPATAEVISNAFEPEDEFQNFYATSVGQTIVVIAPPYHLKTLHRLTQESNTLGPCIEAMVTNIDGTGFEFESDDMKADDSTDDKNIDFLWDFFGEPWPGESFVTTRKDLRRDLETTGNGYLEVIRNLSNDIVFLRHVDSKMVRLVRLDEAVTVTRTVKRRGVDVSINIPMRERRYAQLANGKTLVYFKDFMSKRDLDKTTGLWADDGVQLAADKRATEMIHFVIIPDAHTPYGVPRWINQLPSVLGSRKSEEFNLAFFDNGGVPPVMILLSGGALADETRRAMEQKTSGLASKNNRVQVIQIEPTSGSIQQTVMAKVQVERFGAERQADSMFEGYDKRCSERVRRSFRLPPMFLGETGDHNFATAYASYTVAEAQVFKMEREEFDEVMSIRLLPVMGFKGYRMRSNPINIKDGPTQIQALTMVGPMNIVDPENFLEAVNEATGLSLKYLAPPPAPTPDLNKQGFVSNPDHPKFGQSVMPYEGPSQREDATPLPSPASARKHDVLKSEGILALATDTALALRKRDGVRLASNMQLIATLSPQEMGDLKTALSTFAFIDPTIDADGLAELAGCTIAYMATNRAGQ